MKDRKLATRYARALLSSLPDASSAQAADRFLGGLRAALVDSSELRGLMHDPAVPRDVRRSVLRQLAESHSMPRQVVNFLATVVDHNRSGSIPSIAEVFHELREEREGIVAADVTTAQPLTEELKQQMLRTLEKVTGRSIRLTTQHDPSLIGGAVTRIGSRVYDGSLRTQLEKLRRKMIQE